MDQAVLCLALPFPVAPAGPLDQGVHSVFLHIDHREINIYPHGNNAGGNHPAGFSPFQFLLHGMDYLLPMGRTQVGRKIKILSPDPAGDFPCLPFGQADAQALRLGIQGFRHLVIGQQPLIDQLSPFEKS